MDSARLGSQVKIYMCIVTVPEMKKKSKLKVVHKYTQSKSLLNKRSKC